HGVTVCLHVPLQRGPTVTRWTNENAAVSPGEEQERLLDAPLLIELGAAGLAERLEPGGVDKIGNHISLELVAELVSLSCIADFVGVEPDPATRLVDVRSEVDVGIGQHLEELVAGRHGPLLPALQVCPREYLSEWQTLVCQVVIAEGPGSI